MKKKRNMVLQNLVVDAYAAGGKSIARLDGKVVFIEGAVPGDIVDVRLTKNKKDCSQCWPNKIKKLGKSQTFR